LSATRRGLLTGCSEGSKRWPRRLGPSRRRSDSDFCRCLRVVAASGVAVGLLCSAPRKLAGRANGSERVGAARNSASGWRCPSRTRRMRRGVAGAGFLEDRTLVFLVQANSSAPGSVHRGERHTEEKSHLAIRFALRAGSLVAGGSAASGGPSSRDVGQLHFRGAPHLNFCGCSELLPAGLVIHERNRRNST